jgi:negative regulator of flagellin synthesis FlgM
MKIKETSPVRGVGASSPAEVRRSEAQAASAPSRVSTEATAQLDAAALAARQIASAGHATRLEAIEAAIRQGTFKPDPQRIAQSILDSAELTAELQAMLNK